MIKEKTEEKTLTFEEKLIKQISEFENQLKQIEQSYHQTLGALQINKANLAELKKDK